MHLRPMLQADIPSVAAIGAKAFVDDELFSWLHPYGHTHYASWYNTVLQRARRRLHEPASHAFVAVLDHRDTALGPEGTVVGYCFWERCGPPSSTTAVAWRRTNLSLSDWIERRLLSVEAWYANLIRMDRSASRPNKRIFNDLDPFQDDIFAEHCPDNWHLRVIAVDPAFQHRGIGRLLIEWGLTHARREDVPATLEASAAGSRLYLSIGFKTISWMGGIPIPDSEGGQVMIYDPQGRYTRKAVGDERVRKVDGIDKRIDVVWKSDVTPADVAVAKQVEADVDQLGNKP